MSNEMKMGNIEKANTDGKSEGEGDTMPTALLDTDLDDFTPQTQNLNVTEDKRDISATSDSSDAKKIGKGQKIIERTFGETSVGRQSCVYNMSHKRRGVALIFAHEHFATSHHLQSRPCARHDAQITKDAFKSLGFDIKEFWNLDKKDFKSALQNECQEDHSDCDGLVVVFMSHGGLNQYNNKEYIWTYDCKVDTSELWKNFTPQKCPSLAGKPKMFFIQACRGEDTDKGVHLRSKRGVTGMRVSTDSYDHRKQEEEDYVIPQYADMLFMWASYPGMFAFKSTNNGINGSVFLHFLAKVLIEDGHNNDMDLATMLLRVTREVAIQYESYVPMSELLNHNKQIPYTVSTLMRKVFFSTRQPTNL